MNREMPSLKVTVKGQKTIITQECTESDYQEYIEIELIKEAIPILISWLNEAYAELSKKELSVNSDNT